MKVLVAVDGSPLGDAAVDDVAARNWPPGTDIEVLTVIHSRTPLLPDPAMVMAAIHHERLEQLRERAPGLVDAAADRIRRRLPHLSVTTQVREGQPADSILKEAADWGADLIVLGSHARGLVARAVLGSVASGVAAAAECGVDIIRSGRPAASAPRRAS